MLSTELGAGVNTVPQQAPRVRSSHMVLLHEIHRHREQHGGSLAQIPDPPLPPALGLRPPRESRPFLVRVLALKVPQIFCCARGGSKRFFSPHVSILKILRILWGIESWMKMTKTIFLPPCSPTSSLAQHGLGPPCCCQKCFHKKVVPPNNT